MVLASPSMSQTLRFMSDFKACGYLTLLAVFNLIGKNKWHSNNAGHDNTEHVLTTNLACIFL